MKKCDVCNKEELIQYRVKSINYKNWIFCCTECWHVVSKQDQYAYGGTRKTKKSKEIRKDELQFISTALTAVGKERAASSGSSKRFI